MGLAIGVCSWSLQPSTPVQLAERVVACGVKGVQLALDPIREGWGVAATARTLGEANIEAISGMFAPVGEDYSTIESIRRTGGIVPDEHWRENQRRARENAAIARELGLGLVTTHGGFLPEDGYSARAKELTARLRVIADIFGEHGAVLALETGQESPVVLLQYLAQLPGVMVNFDPANMLLYGTGEPSEALGQLRHRVVQLHAKDAKPSKVEGEWGLEVRLGTGDVPWSRIFATAPRANFVIERESGEQRVADVRSAVGVLEAHVPLMARR